jgi:1,4-dihydroxy-6-naphthoate synthase
MRKHIDLYVNEFSDDVGDEGIAAVRELFKRAHAAGILPDPMEPKFV